MTARKSTRLQPGDWIKAAFRALARHGVNAVNAEALARTLKTTKGSFYWHFKDVPAFHRAMLDLWQKDATAAVAAMVDNSAGPGRARLELLAEIVTSLNSDNEYGGLSAEPSIRDWARTDAKVAKRVCLVDARRIAYVAKLFAEEGFPAKDAERRAELFYAGFVGLQTLAATRNGAFHKQLRDLLSRLLER
jgi:AcrR family transcriptional regulator